MTLAVAETHVIVVDILSTHALHASFVTSCSSSRLSLTCLLCPTTKSLSRCVSIEFAVKALFVMPYFLHRSHTKTHGLRVFP